MNIWLFIKNYYKWSLQEITIWCGGLFSNEQYKRNKSNSTRSKYGPFRNFSDIYFLNICAHVLFVASNFSHNVYRRLIVERERGRETVRNINWHRVCRFPSLPKETSVKIRRRGAYLWRIWKIFVISLERRSSSAIAYAGRDSSEGNFS